MDCRQHLRQATATMHQQVDRAFSAFQLTEAAGYRGFLCAHARVLLPLEQVLDEAEAAQLLADWPQRRRSAALRADLADLAVMPPPALVIDRPADEGALWGLLYVLEGSRLGGRVLAERVRRADPDQPLRYLSHGNTAPLWPRFLERLQRRAAACNTASMQAAAVALFARFAEAARQEQASAATAAAVGCK